MRSMATCGESIAIVAATEEKHNVASVASRSYPEDVCVGVEYGRLSAEGRTPKGEGFGVCRLVCKRPSVFTIGAMAAIEKKCRWLVCFGIFRPFKNVATA